MAKKKAVKKTATRKKVAKSARQKSGHKKATKKSANKSAAVRKRASSKAAAAKRGSRKEVRRSAKRVSTRPRKVSSRAKRPTRQPLLGPNEYLEKVTLTITGPDASGDLIATEEMGGVARVHHTVHAGSETTAIPGKSYRDLKKLGKGTHEVEVVRSLAPPSTTAQSP